MIDAASNLNSGYTNPNNMRSDVRDGIDRVGERLESAAKLLRGE
jgi:hypothetical protein